ncbi:inter-alpha-trypsin inhibitor-like isoform X2 [Phyllobates terribilis]|uniref:inter-alpha-trypsin inhibitor-like isoform X2 n=1 Tax=Phyllobates terribilis TaxID=111132 RepID=UPI003CCAA6A3
MMGSMWIFLGLLLAGVTKAKDQPCAGPVVEDPSGTEVSWIYEYSQDSCRIIRQKVPSNGETTFSSEKDCLSNCSRAYSSLYPTGDAVCELRKDQGPCMALIFMWYYDQERRICDSFFYGGCAGNGNRFEDKNKCIQLCVAPKKGRAGASDVDQNSEPSGSGTDAGLIVGVVFGVIFGAAFLVTLGLYLVQRKKLKKQKHQPVPDTEMK